MFVKKQEKYQHNISQKNLPNISQHKDLTKYVLIVDINGRLAIELDNAFNELGRNKYFIFHMSSPTEDSIFNIGSVILKTYEDLKDFLEYNNIQILINCSYDFNPEILVKICDELKIEMYQISTDTISDRRNNDSTNINDIRISLMYDSIGFDWIEALLNENVSLLINNKQVMYPISIQRVSKIIYKIIDDSNKNTNNKIYHIRGDQPLTKYEMIMYILIFMGLDDDNFVISPNYSFDDNLDMTNSQKYLSYPIPFILDVLPSILKELDNLPISKLKLIIQRINNDDIVRKKIKLDNYHDDIASKYNKHKKYYIEYITFYNFHIQLEQIKQKNSFIFNY